MNEIIDSLVTLGLATIGTAVILLFMLCFVVGLHILIVGCGC
jgi:hypothetical protein